MAGLYDRYIRLTDHACKKKDYIACHQEKTTTCILHVVPIATHTPVRLKSMEKAKKLKEKKGHK